MACEIDDREGESPSPMEPRLGRRFHSSATGRRRERIFPEALGLRQALHPRDDTAGSAGSEARTTRSAAAHRTPIASPARMRDPNRQSDRTRGGGATVPERAPTQDPRRPNRRKRAHRMMASTRSSGDAYSEMGAPQRFSRRTGRRHSVRKRLVSERDLNSRASDLRRCRSSSIKKGISSGQRCATMPKGGLEHVFEGDSPDRGNHANAAAAAPKPAQKEHL